MDWKDYFDVDLIERGFDYYLNEKVYDVVITDNTVTAKVDGSHSNTYEVNIHYNDNNIESMYCTCPYAYSMDYCKHMVATLYEVDDIQKNKKENIDYNTNTCQDFKNILDNLDETLLKEYIYEKFREDNEFINEFIDNFQPKDTREIYWQYVDILNNIFDIDLLELYNGNAYFEESPLNTYLYDFLKNKVPRLYKSQEYTYIQKLLYMIYEKIATKEDISQYIDVDNILDICDTYLGRIIEEQDILDKDETYNYIINNIQYEYNKYTTPHLAWICLTHYDTIDYQTQTLDTLNEIIEKTPEIPEQILLARYQLMLRLGYPIKNIEDDLLKYKQYPEILKILTKSAIKDKDYQKAIQLLEEDKENKDNHSLEDTRTLLKLYKKVDDKEKYKKEVKSILLDYNINEITYIEQLKQACSPTEWQEELEKLIQSYTKTHNYEFINKIYVNEKEYEKLYQNVIQNCPLDTIEEYKQFYKDEHSRDIQSIYKNIILEEQKTARHKGAYTLIIKYLELMLTYPDSKENVLNLIKTLKNKNKRKELLINELNILEDKIKSST